jgi:hypothetical protein
MIIDSPIISGSYAASGSLNQLGNVVISGSLTVTGSIIGTASFAETASYLSGYVSPFPFTGSAIISGSLDVTGSFNVSGSGTLLELNADVLEVTGSVIATSGFTGSLQGTASYAVTASNAVTASYLTGYISPFPFTGSAIVSGSLEVTGSVAVSNLQGTGVRYLVTDASGSVTAQTASAAIKQTQAFTSSANQTSFTIDNGYTTGLVDVFINGSKLAPGVEFTDTSGTVITLATGSNSGDLVEFVKYFPVSGVTNNALRQQTTFTASAGQTVFSASYTPGLLDIFYNGSRLSNNEYTANNGTFFTLATGSVAGDILDVFVYSYQVGAFSGIGGQGVANQVAYFGTTNAITGSPNFTISGSTMTVTGSLIVSGSGTFTNIGPAVMSGSLNISGSLAVGGSNVVLSNQTSSLNVSTASFAATASSADNLLVRNTLTAQTLVVQTITSSVDFVTGSTQFGSLLSNTHVFSGSVTMNPGGLFVSSSGFVGIGTTSPTEMLHFNSTTNGAFIRFQNTGGSGVYLGGRDNNMELYAGGSERMRISGSGNVGIGTTNPTTKLHVYDASNTFSTAIGGTGGAQIVAIGNASGIASIQGFSNNTFAAYSNLSLNAGGGNVGIGTSSPKALLSLGISAGTDKFFLYDDNATYPAGDKYGFGIAVGQMQIYSPSTTSNIAFGIRNSTTGVFSESMRITSGGNVGIGTNNPAMSLQIGNGTGTGNQYLRLFNSASDIYLGQTQSNLFAAGNGQVLVTDATYTSNLAIGTLNASANLIFGTNSAERMRIASTGHVGISVTPSPWATGTTALQIGTTGTLWNRASDGLFILGSNSYYNGSADIQITTGTSNRMYFLNGGITFDRAASAAAGSNTSWNNTMTMSANGSIGAPSGTNIYNASDIRLKQNISTITDGLSKIIALNPVKFNWIDDFESSENGKELLGFIAQEVQGILPEAVENFGGSSLIIGETVIENPLRVNEKFIIPVLVKALQEANAKITSLEEKLERNNII